MEALRNAAVEELSEVNEIGPVIAKSVHDFLHGQAGAKVLGELAHAGLKMEAADRDAAAGKGALAGKTLVVTGALVKYSRDEINELITRHGGHAASSVSKNTDYLVAGEKAGSKLAKAQELGVPVLSEEDFEKLVAG
jgi:DNA ligase (NAD+)